LALICIFEASTIFPEGIELEAFIVYNTSSTLAILFLLGVAARPFCACDIVTSAEGLKTSNVFVPSTLVSSILSVFGSTNLAEGAFDIAVNSSIFYVGGTCSFTSAIAEVSPPNLGTVAGSM
jgi:asparagine N-glycosylation enzyme membrane subunit Stt3